MQNSGSPAAAPLTDQQHVAHEILDMFHQNGGSLYGGEGVTQHEHALQAAYLAEQAGADANLIVAALLHDVGHLLHDLPDDAPEQGIDDVHEELGAQWLASRFPAEVLVPVQMHVASKRYLCATEEGYWDALSEPSKVSLELQGGPMSHIECEQFRSGDHFEACIQLRRWDDEAKVVGLKTPPLKHFVDYIGDTSPSSE